MRTLYKFTVAVPGAALRKSKRVYRQFSGACSQEMVRMMTCINTAV